jgi:hypothetical protein
MVFWFYGFPLHHCTVTPLHRYAIVPYIYGTVFAILIKILHMKKLFSVSIVSFMLVIGQAQGNKTDLLQSLESYKISQSFIW